MEWKMLLKGHEEAGGQTENKADGLGRSHCSLFRH